MKTLEAKHIRKSFDGVVALADANFSLNKGEICGLVGANGSGKTTFARILSGLLIPDDGELMLCGTPINLKSHMDADAFRIAMVHQNFSLIPEMTIWENINLGKELCGRLGFLDKRCAIERATNAMAKIGATFSVYEKVSNISPDEKQLVEIAKALVKNPEILILDEPTASLDFNQVRILFDTIKALKKLGVSVIFISHRIWEITSICDRLVAFRNGETVGELDFAVQERDERLIVPLITGQAFVGACKPNVEQRALERSLLERSYALELEHVSYKDILFDINFTVRTGEILGIGGLQGQGQEELLLLLSGFLRKSTGTIKIRGKRVNMKCARHAVKEGMVLIPGDRQKEGLFPEHSIFANLIYPKLAMYKGTIFLPMDEFRKQAEASIVAISLVPPDRTLIVSHLSGGNQQKVVIGKWLMLSPHILLLNDPTKGVDVGTRNNIYRIITEMARCGTSVILYASDNEELILHCDRILIMFEGRIIDEICEDEICEDRIITSSLNINQNKNETKTEKP